MNERVTVIEGRIGVVICGLRKGFQYKVVRLSQCGRTSEISTFARL